jgi:hypothetical protein
VRASAGLTDARLDGQAQEAGLAHGPADLAGQPADVVAQGAAAGREVPSLGHRPTAAGARASSAPAAGARSRRRSEADRQSHRQGDLREDPSGCAPAKEHKDSPRRIDAAVAPSWPRPGRRLAGVTRDSIYI